jgi:hypothetical protein
MKKWNIFVTFFRNLYDEHYTADSTWNPENFTFVKVNDDYPLELEENRVKYDVFVEHDFGVFSPDWQKRGYCENSVLYHLYRNGVHKKHDYIGFIEYDHVLTENFTATIQKKLDEAREETYFRISVVHLSSVMGSSDHLEPVEAGKGDGPSQFETELHQCHPEGLQRIS